jgi:hypothetical protein
MPLLASLVGNDYTPPTIDLLFPAGAKVSERIERVARTLREQHATRTSAANHGDAAADFVRRVVAKLCCRPYTDERTLDELTDAVIEATIQYVLPLRRECCALHPFCEHERYASSGMSTRAHTPAPLASSSSSSSSESAAAAYAAAQRRGHLHLVTHSWLYPGRVYLWSGLEDPSGPCGRVGRLAVAARTAAYLAIEAGLGGMRYPAPTGELLEEIKQDHEACKLLGVEDGEAETGAEDADQDQLPTPAEEDVAPPRTITEYGRQGSSNRIIVHAIDLPAPLNEDAPCLAPLDDRLNMYLKHLGADTPEIRALPPRLHPFVAVVRLCIAQAAEGDTAGSRRWRRSEVEAVLRAGIGCLQGGWADVDAAATDEADNADSTADYAQGDYPLLTNRSAELVSQLTCAFIDAQLVAQALLLTPEQEVDGDGDRRLTHMSPYVFFSGVALHSLLAGVEPGPATQCGWHWSVASCNGPYHSALAAVLASLPEDAVATGASLEAKKKKKKDKDKKRVNGTGAAAPAKSKSDLVSLGSRFDALLLADI